jgi:hypothetical protein
MTIMLFHVTMDEFFTLKKDGFASHLRSFGMHVFQKYIIFNCQDSGAIKTEQKKKKMISQPSSHQLGIIISLFLM